MYLYNILVQYTCTMYLYCALAFNKQAEEKTRHGHKQYDRNGAEICLRN